MSAFKIYDDSKNYTAQVVTLPVKQKVEGLDNLVKVTVFGNDCLIGKDSSEDDLYLFFPAGTQLSEVFLKKNNLYREQQLNSDPTQKGFFELNGRVKAIKFKGVLSTGFVIPILSLPDEVHISPAIGTFLTEGDSFNEIDGVEICRKYVVPGPTQAQGTKKDRVGKINDKLSSVLIPNQFRFHTDTAHLANHVNSFDFKDIIVITDKWHGSSCILSKVYVNKKLNWYERILNFLGGSISDRVLAYIYSSGKPKSNLPKGIEGLWKNTGYDFYQSNIWSIAMQDYRNTLEDGISLYGELVGYTKEGAFIQKGYDYGCNSFSQANGEVAVIGVDKEGVVNPQYKFIVYRITYTKPDGNVIEFSWQQIKEYCKKYKLEHAKELYFGTVGHWCMDNAWIEESSKTWQEDFFNGLQVAFNMEKNCEHCANKVPAEGIVVRKDGLPTFSAYKLKSKLFIKGESEAMDAGEVNIEDNA